MTDFYFVPKNPEKVKVGPCLNGSSCAGQALQDYGLYMAPLHRCVSLVVWLLRLKPGKFILIFHFSLLFFTLPCHCSETGDVWGFAFFKGEIAVRCHSI